MKKFSVTILSLLILMIVFVGGCTKADNATLVSIQEKFSYISSNNEEIFVGDLFNPSYNDSKLQATINDPEFEKYYNLKSVSDMHDFVNNSSYGLLYRAVSSTSLYNRALNITNNEITDKEYKKNMYVALENLQEHVKNLNSSKKVLESVFANSSKAYVDVASEQTALYDLEKYTNDLNVCLNDLFAFNKNYNLAMVNNISKPIDLNELLYEKVNVEVSHSDNNHLINTCNLLMVNYVMKYSINLKCDVNENSNFIESLRTLLLTQASLKSDSISDISKVENYKLLRMMEDSLVKEEVLFEESCSKLSKTALEKEEQKDSFDKNVIQNYKNKLIDYSSKLIKYLKSL